MLVNNRIANSAQLRRNNLDTQQSGKSSTKAAESEAQSTQANSSSRTDGQVLHQLGDKASDAFTDLKKNIGGLNTGGILDGIKDVISRNADERAAELFEGVDTDNPTLVANEGGFDVKSSQGPKGSTYIDLGDGAEVFVITQPNGDQIAYRVENGELGERIPSDGSTDIGNGIHLSTGESPTGESEINFQQGRSSLLNLRPPTMTLNSDNSMLTVKNREGSNFLDFFKKSEINSFDIQSGDQIVTDGVADLDNMSPQQQFDYYADTPEGARILNTEGNHYTRDVEKRLFVARAQFERGEGGPELFNEFTPRRASLSGDDLVAYDAAVQDMMNEIREEGVYTSEGPDGTIIESDAPINESLLYILASSTIESYGESPELIDAIQGDLKKYILSTDNEDAIPIRNAAGEVVGDSAGWYRGSTGEVQFGIEFLVNDFVQPEDNFEMVTHEFAHSLDNVDGPVDGIPPGLSAEDTQMLTDERDRLFDIAYPDGLDRDERGNFEFTDVVDNSGFRSYTFYNEKEFWAELSATFLASDGGAEIVKDASPELYNMLREYYGREDLPAAATPSVIIESIKNVFR